MQKGQIKNCKNKSLVSHHPLLNICFIDQLYEHKDGDLLRGFSCISFMPPTDRLLLIKRSPLAFQRQPTSSRGATGLDPNQSGRVYVPDPVGGRRRDVDSQRSLELLNLHGEEERRVGHFLHLLFDELCFCGFLKVFGFGDLVHEAHDLAGLVTPSPTLWDRRRNLVLLNG